MGEQNVKQDTDETIHQAFMKSLLTEVRALEKMLDDGLFETGISRIAGPCTVVGRLPDQFGGLKYPGQCQCTFFHKSLIKS